MSARLPSRTLIIAASLLVRATVAVVLGLGVDEAYAVSVARPWSVSYFDHPPLHFWLAGAMTWLTGSTEAIAVRLPFLVLFTGTLWLVGQLTARAVGDVAARYAVLALAASGVLGITSGSWVLPDGPLLFLSMLGVYLLYPLVVDETTGQEPAEHGKWRWFAAGLAFGAAALAKYHALLLVSGLGMYLLLDAHARRHLRTPWPWMALLIVMVACTPVVWWNAQHEWVSFRFQG
ncbi:MAG: ArnT family glycosyltransferase, partial [Gemmatimonas sp.]